MALLSKKISQSVLFVSIMFSFIFSVISLQAEAETIEDGRYWFNLSLAGPLPASTYSWAVDLRARWRDEGRNFDQFIASGYVIKQIDSKLSLGLGIDHLQNHPAGREPFEENRLTPQMIYKFDDIGNLKLQSRTRFEFRQREDFDDTAYRLREMLRVTYVLPQYPNVTLVASDEFFLNANNTDWNVRRGIDQNRAFIGVNYKINAHASIESGYLNQFVNTRANDRENHIINSTIRYNF